MVRPFPNLLRPLLFAHRGASRFAPENTWDAFELALAVGADVLEVDVHRTRDGEIVILHDATVDRTTDGHGRVRDLTYAELAALDAGFRFARAPGEYPFRGRGAAIPRLTDVLEHFHQTAFNIEIKQREPSMVRATLEALARVANTDVVLAAEDDRVMAELEAARPGVPLGLSRRQVLTVLRASYFGPSPSQFAGRALQIPPRYFGLPLATGRVLGAARAAGIEVHLWTLDEPRAAAAWFDREIDGIMSNDPGALADLAIRAKERRAGRPLGRPLPRTSGPR